MNYYKICWKSTSRRILVLVIQFSCDLFVIAIVLVSTFMHAGWNLLACKVRSEMNSIKRC
jgi:hypothetical protein